MSPAPSPWQVMRMLEEHQSLAISSWSVGVPGAIAEFHRMHRDWHQFISPRRVLTEFDALRIALSVRP